MLQTIVDLCRTGGYDAHGFGKAEEFLELKTIARPSVIVIDIRLDAIDGLKLQELLLERQITIPVIVISAYADVPTAVRCLRKGALTLLEKPFQRQELLAEVKSAISADAVRVKLEKHWKSLHRSLAGLTAREQIVLDRLLEGRMNKSIAKDLKVSLRTIEQDRARILRKFKVSNSTELAVKVTELKFLSEHLLRENRLST